MTELNPANGGVAGGGAVFLAAACVVLVICIGTIGWAARYHQRYRRFSTDFAASVENAGKIGAALTRNGETSSLDPEPAAGYAG